MKQLLAILSVIAFVLLVLGVVAQGTEILVFVGFAVLVAAGVVLLLQREQD